MSKQLYQEALADVKKVKEIAEANAKRALEEAVTPRIRELIERALLKESPDDPDEDEFAVGEKDPDGREVMLDVAPMSVSPEDTSSAITPPDAEGKVTLDLDALAASSGAPVEQPLFDVPPSDDGDASYDLDADSIAGLAPVLGPGVPITDIDSEMHSVGENIEKCCLALEANRALPNQRERIAQMISRVENMYEYVQTLVSDKKERQEREIALESLYRDLNKLQEQDMSKKNVNEADLTLKLTNVDLTDEDNLEDIGVELITGEEEEGDESVAPEGDEELETGDEGGDVDLGDLGLGDEEGGEEDEEPPAFESLKLSDDTIVEIDEGMLRREIMRMKKLREDAASKGANLDASVLDDFGDGDVDGEPFLDGEVTTEADDDEEEKKEPPCDEARDDVAPKPGQSQDTAAAQSQKRGRSPGMKEGTRQARRQAMIEALRKRRAARLAENKNSARQNGEQPAGNGDVAKLRAQLAETSLINAKLLYTNKLLQSEALTARQKAQVIERLDEARTLREAKLIYDGLVKILTGASQRVNESAERGKVLGSASRVTKPGASSLTEGFETDRWAQLAGITKK